MRNPFPAVILWAFLAQGCCHQSPRTEPNYPTEISGWNIKRERGLTILGNFVLRQNQAIDNGKLQIKLLEVKAGDPCVEAGDERHEPRITLQFVRLRDGKTLCEETFSEKGSRAFAGSQCQSSLNEFGIMGIYVISVNMIDKWVFFELRG